MATFYAILDKELYGHSNTHIDSSGATQLMGELLLSVSGFTEYYPDPSGSLGDLRRGLVGDLLTGPYNFFKSEYCVYQKFNEIVRVRCPRGPFGGQFNVAKGLIVEYEAQDQFDLLNGGTGGLELHLSEEGGDNTLNFKHFDVSTGFNTPLNLISFKVYDALGISPPEAEHPVASVSISYYPPAP